MYSFCFYRADAITIKPVVKDVFVQERSHKAQLFYLQEIIVCYEMPLTSSPAYIIKELKCTESLRRLWTLVKLALESFKM